MHFNPFPSKTQKIPAELADRLPACGNLWLLLRSWDVGGVGTVAASIYDIAAVLRVTLRTVKGYIRQCLKLGLLIAAYPQPEKGLYKFRLTSMPKVCRLLGIERTSTVFTLEPEDIPNRKFEATEAVVANLQKRSEHARYKEEQRKQETKKPRFDKLSSLVDSASGIGGGILIHKGKRFAFVEATATVYGASLDGIAKQLERGKATIQRRLSNRHRAKLNAKRSEKGLNLLQSINRIQIALKQEVSPKELVNLKSELYFNSDLLKNFICSGFVFKTCPNLYSVDSQVHRTGRINSRISNLANR
jgi:hypothetical protein